MNKSVYCDKCGYSFEIAATLSEIQKDDIVVQYFECPQCKARFHVCTTNTEMRRLIDRRGMIQHKIAEGRKNKIPAGIAQQLQHTLSKIIARQKKLMPRLKNLGEGILNDSDVTS